MNQYNYSEYKQTSVKVHHPPGGGSQFSIGWSGEDQPGQSAQAYSRSQQQQPRRQMDPYQRGGVGAQQQDPYDRQGGYSGAGGRQQRQQNQQQQYGGGNDFGQAASYSRGGNNYGGRGGGGYNDGGNYMHGQNLGYQPRTENNIGDDNRTSVKVHNPPGGRSSVNVFGGDDNVIRPTNNRGQPMRQAQDHYNGPDPIRYQRNISDYQQMGGYQGDKRAQGDINTMFGGHVNHTQENLRTQQRAQAQRHSDAGNFHQRYGDEFLMDTGPEVQFPSQVQNKRGSRQHDYNSGYNQQPAQQRQWQNQAQAQQLNQLAPARVSINIHDNGGDKTSVKVHNPPGGRSSFQLF